ncbi:MAG: NADH-quinone oxidoreductase subunit NuoF [Candidatus Cloacimonetes bacterium]|nr:NADH-quinone oxidoreductase subunit NuoF [Candidatus Cloacimonadota bacterium]
MPSKRTDILLCCGSECVSAGSLKIKAKLLEELKKQDIAEEVNIIETGCMGPCDSGPVMMVYPEGIFYRNISIDDVSELVEEHLIKGRPLTRLMMRDINDKVFTKVKEIPFYKKQIKVALENCGYIDPEKIEEYIAFGGYEAIGKILIENSPQETIDIVSKSGLRGRGGAGYPTGEKWQFCYDQQSEEKYVICNADEGDPGSFIDRSILEGDPHRVLEGMMLAAYAIGAKKGYFYIRAEYPLAICRIKKAISLAYEYGLLGKNIFETEFCFEAEVRTGAGAFVCGEETALIASIEGRRGFPNSKPPYPAKSGLWTSPTVVNNVETLANFSAIFNKGAEWFASMGTESSKGTKVFALSGDVKNTGLVEVPMGVTMRELVYEIGGGIPDGKSFKAVQLGGPSGGCLTSDHLDTKIDYESLKAVGTMLGSGGVIVMNEDNCMVNLAKFFLEFSLEESCGKCTPCRVGLKQMYEIMERITSGAGKQGDIEELEQLGKNICELSLCGLGQSAPNPVLSTIRYFRHEYESHINEKNCPTKVCSHLMHYLIDTDKCNGCGLCSIKCPVDCIPGNREEKYNINQEDCVKCGNCMEACPESAINKISGIGFIPEDDSDSIYG